MKSSAENIIIETGNTAHTALASTDIGKARHSGANSGIYIGRGAYTEGESRSDEGENSIGNKSVIKETIQNTQGEEPTLKYVFQAVQICNTTLITLSNQFQYSKEDVTIISHDMEKVWRIELVVVLVC